MCPIYLGDICYLSTYILEMLHFFSFVTKSDTHLYFTFALQSLIFIPTIMLAKD